MSPTTPLQISALKFTLAGKDCRATLVQVESKQSDGLKALKRENAPAAYVIAKKDLDYLTSSFQDVIDDRGEKKPSIDLARRLLGRQKIPAIDAASGDGGYGSAQRVINGVTHLLLRAGGSGKGRKEENIYFVGVTESLFQRLIQETADRDVPPAEPVSRRNSSLKGRHEPESSPRLIDLLCGVEVPKELEAKFVGKAEEVQLVRKLIVRVAGFNEPVLILGDTGTGKEIVARAIHDYSGKPKHSFFALNCGAIPSELFESELFGIEAGVATSVAKRIGLWELANGGSLFLDELGELSLNHQAKILRALQERKIRRVGGIAEIPVNARIIAATNKDLFSLVQRKQFREDLYYRLRGLLIHTPAVREHPEDIPLLADYLWHKITGNKEEGLPAEIISELQAYSWPGNVRELNAALSALHSLFYDAPQLRAQHLRAIFAFQGQVVRTTQGDQAKDEAARERLEYMRYLSRIYEVVKAAQITVQPLLDKTPGSAPSRDSLSEVQSGLQHRLDELDALLQSDSPAMTRPTFDGISRLHSTLLFFMRVAKKDPHSAIEDLRQTAPTDFSSALALLTTELGTLKDQA